MQLLHQQCNITLQVMRTLNAGLKPSKLKAPFNLNPSADSSIKDT